MRLNERLRLGSAAVLAAASACSEPSAPGGGPPGANFGCTAGTTLALAVGEVRTALAGENVCVRTDASAQYVAHAFFGSTVSSAQTQVGISGFGITTPAGAPALGARVPPSLPGLDGTSHAARSLELDLRTFEKTVLAPRMRAARAAMRRPPNGAMLSTTAAVPAVGDIVQLNASSSGCTSPRMRDGRVVAVTDRSIVISDTQNPAGGFTDAEFRSIGVTFDTLVDPIDRAAFGDPTDIDQNSRVVIFYTRVVNELTPAGSQGTVEGFFHPRDLFPRTTSGGLEGCAGSNMAEIFYMIVPDPDGTINGNAHTKAEVQQVTVSVIAHEYQHLINGGRRLYVNDADDFEEVWLNEGLSHIAEELVFYRAAGLAPRSNVDAPTITPTQKRVDAFNQHMVGNVGRYVLFLQHPEVSSPYAANDSLANRGAIWSFLRYAADRAATSDGTIWFRLVNAKTTGITNLGAVFGTTLVSQMRDWSISVLTDDFVATTSAFRQPSWNFRSIFPELSIPNFPLRTTRLTNGVQATETLVAGGGMYASFNVAAGETAGVAWSVASPAVAISVLRVK